MPIISGISTIVSSFLPSLNKTTIYIAAGLFFLSFVGYLWHDYQQTKILNAKLEENLSDMKDAVKTLQEEAKRQSNIQKQTLASVQSVIESSNSRKEKLTSDIESIREVDRENAQNKDEKIPLPESVSTVFDQLRRDNKNRTDRYRKDANAKTSESSNNVSEPEAPTPLK